MRRGSDSANDMEEEAAPFYRADRLDFPSFYMHVVLLSSHSSVYLGDKRKMRMSS